MKSWEPDMPTLSTFLNASGMKSWESDILKKEAESKKLKEKSDDLIANYNKRLDELFARERKLQPDEEKLKKKLEDMRLRDQVRIT